MKNFQDTELLTLINQFEKKYRVETDEIRDNSLNIQTLIEKEQTYLQELNYSSFTKRIFNFFSGKTAKFERLSRDNYIKMQQMNIVLITAIMRQNRMIMDGIKLTLDKINEIDQETKYIKEKIGHSDKKSICYRFSSGYNKFISYIKNIFNK